MNQEPSVEELYGRIEALRATQIALLTALASATDLDLAGIARSARSWGQKSSAQGIARQAMDAEFALLDAFGALPKR